MILIAANGTGKSWAAAHIGGCFDVELLKYAMPNSTYEQRKPMYANAAVKLDRKFAYVFIPASLAARFPNAIAVTCDFMTMVRRIRARGDWELHAPVIQYIMRNLADCAEQGRLRYLPSHQHLADVIHRITVLRAVSPDLAQEWIIRTTQLIESWD
jgi:hypothetical protein